MECRDSTDRGTQAGLAGVSEEAEATAEAGVEALAEAGSFGVPLMALCTGRIISEERRCLVCQD